MARDNRLFYLSGLLSLSLFSFFTALFFYMLFSSSKINSYALKKDNYISISLEMTQTKPNHPKKPKAPSKVAIERHKSVKM